MIKTITPLAFLITLFLFGNCHSQTSLFSPMGARSMGMGNTGIALSDDETALYHNPAGLGLPNYRWSGGAASCFIFPNDVGIKSLYSVCYQNGALKDLGFSGYLGVYDGASSDIRDFNGNVVEKDYYYDFACAVGAGYRFASNSIVENSLGLSIKYSQADLHRTEDSHANTILGDLGYTLQIFSRIRLAACARNIGPEGKWDSVFGAYKVPLNFGLGIGYKDLFDGTMFRVLDLSTELSYVYLPDPNTAGLYLRDAHTIMAGLDLCFLRTFCARFGLSNHLGVNTLQPSFGTGFSLFNHLDFDASLSYDPEEYANEGISFSISLERALSWSKSDLRWWQK